MNRVEGIEFDQAQPVVKRLVEIAKGFAQQAGVGGIKTAGNLVSYLATHPRDIEILLRFGVCELPMNWHEYGSLTWHAKNGMVLHPDHAWRARIIKQLAEPGDSA